MRRARLLVLVVGLLLCACGDDGAAGGGQKDAGVEGSPADGPAACTAREGGCDPIRQEGCAAPEKCSVKAVDGSATVTCVAAGEAAAGEPCEGISGGDSCAPGLLCASTDEGAYVCMRFCDRACDDCPEGLVCNTMISDTSEWVCGTPPASCDLLAQACPLGEGCYILDPAKATTGCIPAGTGATDAACTSQSDCVPGHLCIAPVSGQQTVCRPLCDSTQAQSCAAGSCVALPGLAPVGYCP